MTGCADTGSPNTPSRTFTGSGVVSNATTWPGLYATACTFDALISATRDRDIHPEQLGGLGPPLPSIVVRGS